MSGGYRVVYEPSAWKQILDLPQEMQQRIHAAIESLEAEARPSGAKKLKDEGGLYRLRVGDYRIVYNVQDDVLLVLIVRVGNRREVYKKR